MTIVIEGMDNSGKSTLARHIATLKGLTIQESEGPPKSKGEINERIKRYSYMKKTLFVRHPCISNPIYDRGRGPDHEGWIATPLIEAFYQTRPFLIYCDPLDRYMEGHERKAHDSDDHLKMVDRTYPILLYHYREWAIGNAHVIYRIGDDISRLLGMLVNEH